MGVVVVAVGKNPSFCTFSHITVIKAPAYREAADEEKGEVGVEVAVLAVKRQ